jgi:NOL1/NOP2/fmu family ribosome biogenesis protein
MNIHFIRSAEKKKILERLKEQFGIKELPYLLVQSGKERIRFFSGSLSKDEMQKIGELANIELIGLYAMKEEGDFRLTLDAEHLIKEQITKNIVGINDEQLQLWLRGNDLQIQAPKGTIAIKYQGDFVGSGKSSGEKIFNYLPKDRRLKK